MRRAGRAAALALLLLAAGAGPGAGPGQAQEAGPVTLVADRVSVSPDGVLLAEGDVEVASGERRLAASSIRYERATGRLAIAGPIRLTDVSPGGAGDVLLADAASLDEDLRSGIVEGARLVIDRQLQLAAAEIVRAGPRFDVLTKVTASSCRVCAAAPVPLWEIRARRVIRDAEARQLYFEGAQFRVAGVPVAWLPRLRLPAPGNERSAGFLRPEIRSTTRLGTGLLLPYFVPLGPTRDLTLTPYLSPETRTLGLRFRQGLPRGWVELEGAATSDELAGGGERGYLFARGAALGPLGTELSFGLELASDDRYLLDYGVTDADVLASGLRLARTRERVHTETGLTYWDTLRGPGEETAPDRQVDALWTRRLAVAGGVADLAFAADAYARPGDLASDTARDDDLVPDGRDAARLAASASWRASRIMGGGLRVTALGGFGAEARHVEDDRRRGGNALALRPAAALGLDLPLRRRAKGAVTDLLVPSASVAWTGGAGRAPDEAAAPFELDEGTLARLNPFGLDAAAEPGLGADLVLSWRRLWPGGEAGLTRGRSFGDARPAAFGPAQPARADWLVGLRAGVGERALVLGRALLDDGGDVRRSETRIAWDGGPVDLEAGYLWQATAREPDGAVRPFASELTLEAEAELARGWGGALALRWDFAADRAQSAGLGLTWLGQCATVSAEATRRFTSAGDLSPETRFGLSVALAGFGDREARAGLGPCAALP